MAPGEDVERGRASSAAERQKSIVSMTEFEGMDEYTALQKYILFYRDPRAAGHQVEEAPKKKKWWQSGGGQATGGVDIASEVPDDCKYHSSISIASPSIGSFSLRRNELYRFSSRRLLQSAGWGLASSLFPAAVGRWSRANLFVVAPSRTPATHENASQFCNSSSMHLLIHIHSPQH